MADNPLLDQQVHAVLLDYLRTEVDRHCPALAARFTSLSDIALVRLMFSNYRGRNSKRPGLRLTLFGLTLMEQHFRSCEVLVPEDEPLRASGLLYLDNKAAMPYYYSGTRLVVFDHLLGVRLKLASGRISILVEIEGGF
jgi:hypothetical protein